DIADHLEMRYKAENATSVFSSRRQQRSATGVRFQLLAYHDLNLMATLMGLDSTFSEKPHYGSIVLFEVTTPSEEEPEIRVLYRNGTQEGSFCYRVMSLATEREGSDPERGASSSDLSPLSSMGPRALHWVGSTRKPGPGPARGSDPGQLLLVVSLPAELPEASFSPYIITASKKTPRFSHYRGSAFADADFGEEDTV
ncbi:hypothetical protein HPB47_016856, partial [Ixodes persulcatus]